MLLSTSFASTFFIFILSTGLSSFFSKTFGLTESFCSTSSGVSIRDRIVGPSSTIWLFVFSLSNLVSVILFSTEELVLLISSTLSFAVVSTILFSVFISTSFFIVAVVGLSYTVSAVVVLLLNLDLDISTSFLALTLGGVGEKKFTSNGFIICCFGVLFVLLTSTLLLLPKTEVP